MTDFSKVEKALTERGYTVKTFPDAKSAAAYLDGELDGTTIGIGGSATVDKSGAYELLSPHNSVVWHWKQEPNAARLEAMTTQVYITSVNALSESGELVSIDGVGNRVSSMLFGHKKLYYMVGRNKLAPTYEEAVWRARNVAAPQRAEQFGMKTPCTANKDKCYDCRSPQRVCRGMVTLWAPMLGTEVEVLLIDEELGL